MTARFPRRGDVFFSDLDPVFGSEQGGERLVLIIQNDIDNEYSTIVIIAALTSAPAKRLYLNEVIIQPGVGQQSGFSRIQLNQLRTIDKRRLGRYVGRLTNAQMDDVDAALKLSLGLDPV